MTAADATVSISIMLVAVVAPHVTLLPHHSVGVCSLWLLRLFS